MNLTKDEARILSAAIYDFKYKVIEDTSRDLRLFDKLTDLEEKLRYFGVDRRRIGRTSQDDWSDLLKRFTSS